MRARHASIGSLFLGAALLCMLSAGFASVATAANITIDDFSTPGAASAYVISLVNGNPFSISHTGAGILNNPPGVPAGERSLSVLVVSNPVGLVDAAGTIGGGVTGTYEFTSANNAAVEATLTYSAPAGAPLGGRDLTDGGTNNALQLSLDSDFAFSIKIDAFGPGGSSTATIGHAAGASSDQVLFASFAPVIPGFDFAALDRLVFTFNTTDIKALDFTLDGIIATVFIPEPSTAILASLGAGLAICVARRRRG